MEQVVTRRKGTGVFEAEEILQHLWAGKCVLELILLSSTRLFHKDGGR